MSQSHYHQSTVPSFRNAKGEPLPVEIQWTLEDGRPKIEAIATVEGGFRIDHHWEQIGCLAEIEEKYAEEIAQSLIP